ncbi:MAG TPA: hypothetical protein VJU82_09385, partial [Acidobacteriaceae bacterium]|nr:hypothetical protein [Acidobacteriaceae bacterium]
MKPIAFVLTCALVSASTAAHADFSYQETTQITGGALLGMMKMAGVFSREARHAGDPVVTTVMVKGNRMIRESAETSEIIDLDAETITQIDHQKKQYTVMTFEQMRQQMEAAMAKARAEQAKQKQQQPAPSDAQNVDVKFNVKVRNTGATKDVAGMNASESILNMTMDATDQTSGQTGSLAITNDMYLAPEIPGYEEVRDFERRYAEKMRMVLNDAINPQMLGMLQQPGASQGLKDMVEELSKLKGVPVLQIMRMGTTANGTPLPAASEAPLPAAPAMPSAGEVAKQSASSAVMSSLPFGGFGRKKKQPDPPPPAASDTPAAAVLIESTTQYANVSKGPV